jgi:hypothetical protein
MVHNGLCIHTKTKLSQEMPLEYEDKIMTVILQGFERLDISVCFIFSFMF